MSFTTAAAKINNNCSMAGWCRFLVVVVLAHIQTMIFKCPNVVHVLFVQCSSGSEQRKPQQEHVSNGQCAAHSIRHCPFSRMLIHSIYTFNERENIPVQGNNDNNEKGKEKQFYGYSKSIVHLLLMLLLLVGNSIVFLPILNKHNDVHNPGERNMARQHEFQLNKLHGSDWPQQANKQFPGLFPCTNTILANNRTGIMVDFLGKILSRRSAVPRSFPLSHSQYFTFHGQFTILPIQLVPVFMPYALTPK